MRISQVLLGISATLAAAAIVRAQTPPASPPAPTPPAAGPQFHWPEKMRNAKVLPKTVTADQLRDTMKGIAVSLGVRCAYCHSASPQATLAEMDFASDANPHKNVARGMMRMVGRLNKDLPAFAGKDAHVTCYTCHRGSPHPAATVPMPTAPVQPTPTPAS
jgi:Photosynthetic reaction centre cytochrome C subunit